MNSYQELWWQQAARDHVAFQMTRSQGFAQCHTLQFLQMATEKIAKTYFWRSGSPPPKSHAGFAQFLRFLGQIRQRDRDRIATLFTFGRFDDFQNWINTVQPMAYALERITPDLANDGPNPEYPWPHREPRVAPANHNFEVWGQLKSGSGRHLMRIIEIAVERFPDYADT